MGRNGKVPRSNYWILLTGFKDFVAKMEVDVNDYASKDVSRKCDIRNNPNCFLIKGCKL